MSATIGRSLSRTKLRCVPPKVAWTHEQLAFGGEVAVGLRANHCRCKIAHFLQQVWDRLDSVGERFLVASAMLVSADVILVKTCHHRRARRRTNRRSGIRMLEANALLCQFVDVRRMHQRRAVTRQIRGPVFNHDPQDVGLFTMPLAGRILKNSKPPVDEGNVSVL